MNTPPYKEGDDVPPEVEDRDVEPVPLLVFAGVVGLIVLCLTWGSWK
jgi:hypothetical protein